MTADCEAEVYDTYSRDIYPAKAPEWRPCRNPAIGEHKGVRLCLIHLGCAVADKDVMLTGGRVLSQRKAVGKDEL